MFGAAKTPFGGGGFGGTTSAFGNTTPFGQSSGGLFGSSTPAAGTFGTPTFGSSTSAFGAAKTTASSVFGGGTSLFGQPQSSSGLTFGTSTGTSGGLFGGGGSSLFQTTTQSPSTFGAKPTGFGGFGSSTSTGSVFGQTSTFGQTAGTTGSLFGGSSAFGATATSGTTIKFAPVVGSEQAQKSGVSMTVKTQNQCITVMDQYSSKSIEELRLEDYTANRKGSTTSSGFAFGSAAPSTGSLFGATASTSGTSLFGSTAKPSAFGGFGTSAASAPSLFGQPSTGTSLFGAKTTGTSLFGATTTTTPSFGLGGGTSLFGNTASTGTGLFGATASQPGTSLFGSTTATTSTGPFGATSAFGQPAASTSLFGAKPAFGFGASAASGIGTSTLSFGQTASSGGLFGSTAAKPAFGSALGTTSAFGTLGATSSSGSLFGNTASGGLFGGQKTTFGGFGTAASTAAGTSLFGGGGLTTGTGFNFGNTAAAGSTLNAANNIGLAGINQNSLAALQQQQLIQQQLKAITNSPFGDSPLFRNLKETTKSDKESTSTTSKAKEFSAASTEYKVLARPAARVKPRPISSPSIGKSKLFEGVDEEVDFSPHSLVPRSNVKKLVIKNKGPLDFNSPASPGQLKLRSAVETENDLIAPSPDVVKIKSPSDTQDEIDVSINDTISDFTPIPVKPYVLTPDVSLAPDKEDSEEQSSEPVTSSDTNASKVVLTREEYYTKPSLLDLEELTSEGQCLVRDFTVGREGYGEVKFLGITDVYGLDLDKIIFFRRREVEVYPDEYENKPAVGEELNKSAQITLLKVWPNDKSSHTPVKSPASLKSSGFIDRIEEKTVKMGAIFIDYRPADGAWQFQVEHFTVYGIQQQFIEDSEEMDSKLQQKIIPSIEEDINLRSDADQLLKEKTDSAQDNLEVQKDNEDEVEMSDSIQMSDEENADVPNQTGDTVEFDITDAEDIELPTSLVSFSHQLGQAAMVSPYNVQRMKSSILEDDDDEPMKRYSSQKPSLFAKKKSLLKQSVIESDKVSSIKKLDLSRGNNLDSLNSSLFDKRYYEERAVKSIKTDHLFQAGSFNMDSQVDDNEIIAEPISLDISNKLRPLKHNILDIPASEDSITTGKLRTLTDASLNHGREFNVRWCSQQKFIHSGTRLGCLTEKSEEINTSIFVKSALQPPLSETKKLSVHLEQLVVVPTSNNQFAEELLDISLEESNFASVAGSILPHVKLLASGKALKKYSELCKRYASTSSGSFKDSIKIDTRAWNLCEALWGEQAAENHIGAYQNHNMRREAVSKWLSQVVEGDINLEIEREKNKDNGHLDIIFSLLSGGQVKAASQVAQRHKELRLALLISQSCGDTNIRHHIRKQLEDWEERNIDKTMPVSRLKIYALLSGLMVWKSQNHLINLCEGIDWRRALALHLWYRCSCSSSVNDALIDYTESFTGTERFDAYAAYPSPKDIPETRSVDMDDGSDKEKPKDLCYHLLSLYCDQLHPLDNMLAPSSHCQNPLEYQLSWHLHQLLESLGYNHLLENKHALLQISYASQLENAGLWKWAVYVLLHLQDDQKREATIQDTLNRWCCGTNTDLTEDENFLVESLSIPKNWIYNAKALHAHYKKLHYEEAIFLLKAGRWDESHSVIIEKLAADAIIDENYNMLHQLLSDIAIPERSCTIRNWTSGGKVFLDYILLKQKLDSIKQKQTEITNYHLEDLETDVITLLNRINIMPVNSSTERLCQSDMARACSKMLKLVFSLKSTDGVDDSDDPAWSAMKVAPYVVDLPLPPDHYLKELRGLVTVFAEELSENDRT